MKDWTGNQISIFKTLGASNHSDEERENNDFYATDPHALKPLFEILPKNEPVWECACGMGHLSKELIRNGYSVISTDLIDRGYGEGGVDFLSQTKPFDGNIVTNPPYKYGLQFAEKGIRLLTEGHYLCLFVKLQFLEGKNRRLLYDDYPTVMSMFRAVDFYVRKTETFHLRCRMSEAQWLIAG